MAIDIQVKESYRGPMDLLLYLIKRDEVDIHDIPISHITNEYTKAVSEMTEIDVDDSSEFLELASMLIEIKGRMLIPPEETEEEEDSVDFDPRSDLVQALLEYKKFKEAAGELDEMYDLHSKRFPLVPHENIKEEVSEDKMIDSNVYELYAAFARMMRETIASASATTIVASEVSTEECIEKITGRLKTNKRVSFISLFDGAPTRPAMVAFFIAILELIRLHKVHAMQSEDFGDIYLEEASPEDFIPSEENILESSDTLGEYVKKVAEVISLPQRHFEIRNSSAAKTFLAVCTRKAEASPKHLPADSFLKIKKTKKQMQKRTTLPFPAHIKGIRNTKITTKNNIICLPKTDYPVQTDDSKTVEKQSNADCVLISDKTFTRPAVKSFLTVFKKTGRQSRKSPEKNIFQLFSHIFAVIKKTNKTTQSLLSDPLFGKTRKYRANRNKSQLPFPAPVRNTRLRITTDENKGNSIECIEAKATVIKVPESYSTTEKTVETHIKISVKTTPRTFPELNSRSGNKKCSQQKNNIFQLFRHISAVIKKTSKAAQKLLSDPLFSKTPKYSTDRKKSQLPFPAPTRNVRLRFITDMENNGSSTENKETKAAVIKAPESYSHTEKAAEKLINPSVKTTSQTFTDLNLKSGIRKLSQPKKNIFKLFGSAKAPTLSRKNIAKPIPVEPVFLSKTKRKISAISSPRATRAFL